MFLLDWYNHYLEIKLGVIRRKIELEKEQVCESCEYLKIECEKKDQLIKELIDKLTNKPEEITVPVTQQEPIKPKFIPWRTRRQLLEAEDRAAAQKLRDKQQEMANANIKVQGDTIAAPADDPDVIALEQEMDLIEKERNNASKIS